MDWKPSERNWDGIPLEGVRRKVDPEYNRLHDELSDAYYNYWRKGLSKPFYGYDVQETPEKSKILFDKLHGLIFQMHILALDEYIKSLPVEEKPPEEELDLIGVSSLRVDSAKVEIEKLSQEVDLSSIPQFEKLMTSKEVMEEVK